MICSPMSFYVKYAGMVSNMCGGYTDWGEFMFVIFLIFILLGILT
jgi:hypothetical protein